MQYEVLYSIGYLGGEAARLLRADSIMGYSTLSVPRNRSFHHNLP